MYKKSSIKCFKSYFSMIYYIIVNAKGARMLNFIAIDFETANNKRNSACSVGYAIVKSGQIVDTGYSLLSPQTGSDFSLTWVHGINYIDTIGAPSWGQFMNHFTEQQKLHGLPDSPLIAHNSPFDKSVWNACHEHDNMVISNNEFYDTLKLSKAVLQLESYKLPHVAKALGINGFNHHNAADDSIACAQIVIEISKRTKLLTVPQLWSLTNTSKKSKKSTLPKVELVAQNQTLLIPEAPNSKHPLYNANVCITGNLLNFSRDEIIMVLRKFGATTTNSITKNTTLLVASTSNTSKYKKAIHLKSEGQYLEIIDEQTLIEAMKYDPS